MALSWLGSWLWGSPKQDKDDNLEVTLEAATYRLAVQHSREDKDDFLNYSPAKSCLDSYIADLLQPTREFNTTANADIDKLVRFFHSSAFPRNVGEVIKGGSLGKGTHIKGKSDIDLVVFLNGFASHEDFLNQREQVRAKLKPYLEAWQPALLKITGSSPGGWQVDIRTSQDQNFMPGDILLAVDNLKKLGSPLAVYQDIKDKQAGFYTYSYSLNPLQVEFIQSDEFGTARSPKLKNVIRLMKKWREQYLEMKISRPPVNYAFELLTIHVWESIGKPQKFKTKDLLRQILETLVNYDQICATWEVNYDLHDTFVSTSIKQERPLILDPANPFYNVAKSGSSFYNWQGTARKAQEALRSPLLV